MFRQAYLCEDMHGLYWDDRYEVWAWLGGPIYVSLTRKGDALVCHFSAAKPALRRLRKAIDDFCYEAFSMIPWCRMIIACMRLPSVVRLVAKCGFSHLSDGKETKIYARYRP